jgi:CrcB protein
LALVVVGAGGALGAVLRYYVTDWVRHVAGAEMPWGTLVVNVLGSLAFGFLLVWLQSRASSAQAREFLAIGFLGSFTTFSTYSYETVALARAGEVWRAGGYALGSLVLGVLAVFVGASLATVLTRGLSG